MRLTHATDESLSTGARLSREVTLMRRFTTSALCLLLLATAACQQRKEPVPTLTLEQWRRVRTQILDELPDGVTAVDAIYGERIALRGYTLQPQEPSVGGDFELVLYWEALEDIDEDWTVFVHFDAGSERQGFDHVPLEGAYPTVRWEAGQIITDPVHGTLESELTGEVDLHVGLYRGEDRMPLNDAGSRDDAGEDRVRLGRFQPGFEPTEAEAVWTDQEINLDGRMTERAWQRSRATSRWVNPVNGEAIDGQDTWAKLIWSDTHLYVGVRARDRDVWATMQERDLNLWEEEVIEVFIDADGSGDNYIELQVNPINTLFDAHFADPGDRDLESARAFNMANLESAVHVQGTVNRREDRDIYWSIEMAIPWSEIPDLQGPPNNAMTLRANLYRYDRPSDDETFATAWAPVGRGSFHQPERFATISLSGRPEDREPLAEVPPASPAPDDAEDDAGASGE